jgi:membrane protein implicated in regulation of membrane protease activity
LERVRFVHLTPAGLLRQLTWRGVLALALGATLIVTLAVVAGVVFLVLLPIILVAGVVARLLAGRRQAERPAPTRRPEVLEGSYEVVEVEERGPARPGDRWRR